MLQSVAISALTSSSLDEEVLNNSGVTFFLRLMKTGLSLSLSRS